RLRAERGQRRVGGRVSPAIRCAEAALWRRVADRAAPDRGSQQAALARTLRYARAAALGGLDPRRAAARDPERGGAGVLGADLDARQGVGRYPRRADRDLAAALEAAIRRVAQEARGSRRDEEVRSAEEG